MKRSLVSALVTCGFASILILLNGFSQQGLSAEPVRSADPLTDQQAFQQLLSTKVFAFGGVGFAGTTSEGERAYRVVAASPNALDLFHSVLKQGSGAAQLYALYGFRNLAPEKFDAFAQTVITADRKVRTMTGCLMAEERASQVVIRIAGGRYDFF